MNRPASLIRIVFAVFLFAAGSNALLLAGAPLADRSPQAQESKWVLLEGESNRYVLAGYPDSGDYGYRSGGWIHANGAEHFLPHDLPTAEYNAIRIELFDKEPASKSARNLQTASRVAAKAVLIPTLIVAYQGYMTMDDVRAASDSIDDMISFAE